MFSNLRSQYFVCIALYNCICILHVLQGSSAGCGSAHQYQLSALLSPSMVTACINPGAKKNCFHRLHAPLCTMHYAPLCAIDAPAGKNLALWPRGRAGAGIYVKSWTPTLCQMHLSRHRTVTNVTCSGGQAVVCCTKVDDRSCVYASKSKPSQRWIIVDTHSGWFPEQVNSFWSSQRLTGGVGSYHGNNTWE